MLQVNALVTYPRLTVYSEENFFGARQTYRGNLGITNLESIFDGIESLRFFSTSPNATLIVFSQRNFGGRYIVYRGSRSLRDLDDLIRGNDVESLISTNQRLTAAQIRIINNTGRLPRGYRRL
ncbi:hypothetical protein [Paenibacillus qinlingensis]|uniref:hypothetical protein n=1 Tax=Paenibacillus qinlingensis TaxID=1837343 RepID=UPI0015673944|nr:hypothetical protein [Paenibacillus qinlingensis]NQX62413.1 hypothetical protein [Paenibacillus qinlingensis]